MTYYAVHRNINNEIHQSKSSCGVQADLTRITHQLLTIMSQSLGGDWGGWKRRTGKWRTDHEHC